MSFAFSFQFCTRLAAVVAEEVLRSKICIPGILATHGPRAFSGAFGIGFVRTTSPRRPRKTCRKSGGGHDGDVRFLLTGFRQEEGAQNCSVVGWISGDGDVRVRIRIVDPDGHRADGRHAGSPVVDKIDPVVNFGGTDVRRRSAGRPGVAGACDLVGPDRAERVAEAEGGHLF